VQLTDINPMTTTAVLFPWLPGDPDRDAAAGWVMSGWRTHLPDIEVLTSAASTRPGAPWSKGAHLAGLLSRTAADIVVVSDVDCWIPPAEIRLAVEQIASGTYAWAIPHNFVRRLTRARTAQLMSSPALADELLVHESELAEPPYLGYLTGGVVAIRRDIAQGIPLDPRFVGWGGEDASWGAALRTSVGEPWRGRCDLLHLWHRPAPRLSRGRGSDANTALYQRYLAADGDLAVMQAILAEIDPSPALSKSR
jgi:hypothetical protein